MKAFLERRLRITKILYISHSTSQTKKVWIQKISSVYKDTITARVKYRKLLQNPPRGQKVKHCSYQPTKTTKRKINSLQTEPGLLSLRQNLG